MGHASVMIFGAGSIGCYLGGRILQGGGTTRFIGRDRYAEVIAEHGLLLSRYDDPVMRLTNVDFQTDPAALKDAEIVALCVKSGDTRIATQMIRQYAPEA